MEPPLITVCMITYNHDKYIKQAVESVLSQNCMCNVELIIADDNSSDNTEEIIRNIDSPSSNFEIRYIKHNVNKTMMGNFLWVLREAKGKYIALCEGDDYWTNINKLQTQLDFLESHPEYFIVTHDAEKLTCATGEIIRMNRFHTNFDISVNFLIDRCITIPTASIFLRNTKSIPSWIKECSVGDWPLIIWSLSQGKGFFMSYPMAVYRKHDQGVSAFIGSTNHYKFLLKTFLHIHHYLPSKAIKKHVAHLSIHSYAFEFRNSKYAFKDLFTAFRYNPLNSIKYSKLVLKLILDKLKS